MRRPICGIITAGSRIFRATPSISRRHQSAAGRTTEHSLRRAERFWLDAAHVRDKAIHLFRGADTHARAASLSRHECESAPTRREAVFIDEALKPASSRFWPANSIARQQPTELRQTYGRDWRGSAALENPLHQHADEVRSTAQKYREALLAHVNQSSAVSTRQRHLRAAGSSHFH